MLAHHVISAWNRLGLSHATHSVLAPSGRSRPVTEGTMTKAQQTNTRLTCCATPAARRFPLLPRLRPNCRALPHRVDEIHHLAHQVAIGTAESQLSTAAQAHNKAALLLTRLRPHDAAAVTAKIVDEATASADAYIARDVMSYAGR